MVVFVNSKGEIKDVGSTNQVDLIGVVLRDEENPFKDWSIAKICCYRIETFDGYVTMMTPYVDTRIIEHIDQLGKQVDNNTSGIQINSNDIIMFSLFASVSEIVFFSVFIFAICFGFSNIVAF